jgi:stage II sporulation protein D
MIARFFVLALGLLPLNTVAEAGIWDKIKAMIWNPNYSIPTIDVLIVNDQPSILLELKGKYHIYDPNTKEHVSTRFVGKKKHIQALSSGLKWGEEFPGTYQLHIVPDHQGIVAVVDGIEYRGSLYIYDIGGTISIVNRTDIEDYLSSILPDQFPDPLPVETCAAIAIAARTNAYYQSLNQENRYWTVDAGQVGYKGLESIKPNSEMAHAIKATNNMVMSKTGTYEGKLTPFAAHWGSITGGQSTKDQAFSHISFYEAEDLGKKGKHAAQILSKAFPNTHIEFIRTN